MEKPDGIANALILDMSGTLLWGAAPIGASSAGANEVEVSVLRSKLTNLTLDWELAALNLDARRFRTTNPAERESLRDSAQAYRKCVAELTEVLSASSLLTGKAH